MTNWRKRRIRRWIITHPRMPLRASWALRRFALTPEQEAKVAADVRELLREILDEADCQGLDTASVRR